MKAGLQRLNFIGVLALAILCVVQWQHDRRLNLELNRSETLRQAQAAKLRELEIADQGANEDLGQLKTALATNLATTAGLERNLALSVGTNHLLMAEREKLKSMLTNCAQTVAIQNERIGDANRRIEELASNLNQSILKFNDLVTNYNRIVCDLKVMPSTNRPSVAVQPNP